MKIYVIGVLAAITFLLAAYTGQQKLDAARIENDRLINELDQEKRTAENAQTLALEFESDLKLERELQGEMQKQQSNLRNQLAASSILIERLKRENKEFYDWSANELPSTVQWLRERPSITGSASYQNWLSSRNRLHLKRIETADQRQSTE